MHVTITDYHARMIAALEDADEPMPSAALIRAMGARTLQQGYKIIWRAAEWGLIGASDVEDEWRVGLRGEEKRRVWSATELGRMAAALHAGVEAAASATTGSEERSATNIASGKTDRKVAATKKRPASKKKAVAKKRAARKRNARA